MSYLMIFLGSGIGGALRYGIHELISRSYGLSFPLGTLVINVSGSLILGLIAGSFIFAGETPHHWKLFLAVGMCGGYTTFSTFSYDAVLLMERGQWSLSALYVVLSVGLSIPAFYAGYWLTRQMQ